MGSRIPDLLKILEWMRLYTHFYKNTLEIQQLQHPNKFSKKKHEYFQKNGKTKMTALPRAIDLKTPRTIFIVKSNNKKEIWEKYVFHHAFLFLTLLDWVRSGRLGIFSSSDVLAIRWVAAPAPF